MKNLRLYVQAPTSQPVVLKDFFDNTVMGTMDYDYMGASYTYPTIQYSQQNQEPVFADSPKNVVGSIYYYNPSTHKHEFATAAVFRDKFLQVTADTVTKTTALSPDVAVSTTTYSYAWKERVKPVGIVVIPAFHMKDKKCRVMSLWDMNKMRPLHGAPLGNDDGVVWGQLGENLSPQMALYDSLPISTAAHVSTGITAQSGYLASQRSDAAWTSRSNYVQDSIDGKTSWTCQPAQYLPSPIVNHKPNPAYTAQRNILEMAINNPLSDFDGQGNTAVLCSLATAQADWRTADAITNNEGAGYSPAACCCAMYHSEEEEDWYLPALGEMCYIPCHIQTILGSISMLRDVLQSSNYAKEPFMDMAYATSTCGLSNNTCCSVHVYSGLVKCNESRESPLRVRAFMAV